MSKIPLKPANSKFTDSQWEAVYDSGQNILVSASAGSGKTTVLVERVIQKIKAGTDIDRLLIVTYTEAAAREMKERIQLAIQKMINDESDLALQQQFVRQLQLLPNAHISTLHAFCLTVIRRYYYLIEMDPVFRLLTDETEMLLLKEDVWEEVREAHYADDPAFYQLTANFSNDRNDDGLTDLIMSLYEFARANPDPEKWLTELAEVYHTEGALGDSSLFQEYLKPPALEMLTRTVDRSEQMIALAETDDKLAKVLTLCYEEKEFFEILAGFLYDNDLEAAFQYLQTISFGRYPTISKKEELAREVSEQIKLMRDENKEVIEKLKTDLFQIEPAKMIEVMDKAYQTVSEMSAVGGDFMHSYARRKAERGLVDFNDLEHFTLQILTNRSTDEWQPSEASAFYRAKFDEVLVDEYQDVNQLQESILYWLRRPQVSEGNVFMVGDVKQSIYSFRLADPTLFIEKYNAYGQGKDGKRIILAENFRSRAQVLDFTNLVFDQLMDEAVGQITYDDAARLVNGFTGFPTSNQFNTELLIYEKGSELTEENELEIEDKTDGELLLTALKIRSLIDSKYLIFDKKTGEDRPITYQDIVLLTPTKKNNIAILETFKRLDIPLQVNDAENYFQATEIRIMIALLQVIDNPYQDIPLAAVLRSPIVGLKENELAELRISGKRKSLFEDFKLFVEKPNENKPLQEKLRRFNEWLAQWRELARRNQLSELIWQIYLDTAYLDYVGGLPAGAQRQANLYALADRAASYEKMSFRGLFQFVRFIEKMQEKDKDLAEPVIAGEENAVRVMTIHASKGLEFPVVFVLDMTKTFNLSDLNTRYIFDDHLGVGIRYLDQDRLLYDTLPFTAIRQAKLRKLLSEEMRKLYVALTRAEQKLFLVGSYADEAAAWKEWLKAGTTTTLVLPGELRLKKNSLMNWVGMTLVRHPATASFTDEFALPTLPQLQSHPARFSITFVDQEALQESFSQVQFLDAADEAKPDNPHLHQELIRRGLKRLTFAYPFESAVVTANYQSVSEIKRVFEDPDETQLLKIDLTQDGAKIKNRYVEEQLTKPRFTQTIGQPTAAEIGTATHTLLQELSLESQPTEDSLNEKLQELVAAGVILENVAKRVDLGKILQFFETDLGQKLITQATQVTREQPFSMLMNADLLFANYPESEDQVLIHGIIDGFLDDGQALILYDFKTDQLKTGDPKELDEITARYRGQLNLYRMALEQVKGRPVTQLCLVLLANSHVIDLL